MMVKQASIQSSEDLIGFFPPSKLPHEKYISKQTKTFLRQRTTYTIAYNYLSSKLNSINPHTFPYLTVDEIKALEEHLLSLFNLVQIQLQYDEVENRHYNHQKYYEALDQCASYLQILASYVKHEEQTLENLKSLNALQGTFIKKLAEPEKYLNFLGASVIEKAVVKSLAQDLHRFSLGKSVAIKRWLSQVNFRRLYWIWGGSMLGSILALLPNDFFNKSQAQWELSTPAPIMGYLSFVLYYIRFSINFYLLLKHTFFPSQEEEKNFTRTERFRAQWEQRKFLLLNDSIWATANLLGFVWLKGAGKLGYIGNVLTLSLLFMDLSLTIWRFKEAKSSHVSQLHALEEAIRAEKTKRIRQDFETDSAYDDRTRQIQAHIEEIRSAQEQLLFAWKYKRYGLINDLSFAIGLVVGFSLMCSFFFPPAMLGAAPLFMLAGAIVCFALTVNYTAINGGIKISKEIGCIQNLEKRFSLLLKQAAIADDTSSQKQLFLALVQNQNEIAFHQAKVNYKQLKLVRSLFVDAIIPAVVFTAFVFMPLGIGLAMLGASLMVALLSHLFIKQFKPQIPEWPQFEETRFNQFKKAPTEYFAPVKNSNPRLFGIFSPKREGYQPISVITEGETQTTLIMKGIQAS